MNRLAKILIPVVLVATAASGIVYAQQMRRERHSPETMQRLQDGRIAMITAALKLTEPQAKLWAPVEAQMRARQAMRTKQMKEWAEKRQNAQKQGEKPGEKSAARAPLPDRLDQMSARMAQAAEQSKAFATVFRPFHESLTEEQKAVIGPLMADMGGKHHGRGHRFGGHRERGAGPGPL